MIFKIVSRVSWLALLIVAILLGKQLAESRQDVEDLSGRLKRVEEQATADEATESDLARARTELAALKKTLSTKNRELEQSQKRSALEREKVLQKSTKERAALNAGIAKALSRFGLSRKELETLLADLPNEDRLRLLEQITVQAAPVEPEEEHVTKVEVTPSPGDMTQKETPLIPKAIPVAEPEQVSADGKLEREPANGKPVKKDEPKFVSYTVKGGDNLTRIGRRFDVNVAQLMKLNGITDANLLRIGQELKIPRH